ncbi:hypothetical protein HBE96_19525 [Clostridium sp. P21]|uniref:Uncharacterized protein n=1 Tax=Clostridium muellerianum TaxID=2716538 RepID=A0A7Y0HPA0_9CLOT|nr:hypothetical protein [Clostridium muellerianum]NMM64799.1 hypothetical protein [Clostridium muellerianum]
MPKLQWQRGTTENGSIRPYGNMYRYQIIDRLHGKILSTEKAESFTEPKRGRFPKYFLVLT